MSEQVDRLKVKVLLVDDFSTMRRIIRGCLTEVGFKDANISEADDGVTALTHLENNHVDFVVTDWNMVHMHGVDLLRHMKKTDAFKDIPVLMVTAEAKKEQIIEAAKSGVSQYIVKPFISKTLNIKVAKIFG